MARNSFVNTAIMAEAFWITVSEYLLFKFYERVQSFLNCQTSQVCVYITCTTEKPTQAQTNPKIPEPNAFKQKIVNPFATQNQIFLKNDFKNIEGSPTKFLLVTYGTNFYRYQLASFKKRDFFKMDRIEFLPS